MEWARAHSPVKASIELYIFGPVYMDFFFSFRTAHEKNMSIATFWASFHDAYLTLFNSFDAKF